MNQRVGLKTLNGSKILNQLGDAESHHLSQHNCVGL